MNTWRQRDVDDDVLRALNLVVEMARDGKDGAYIDNHALQQWLQVDRVHSPRIHALARRIAHILPYFKISQDYLKRATVVFGLTKDKEPVKKLIVESLPRLLETEKRLGIKIVTWQMTTEVG